MRKFLFLLLLFPTITYGLTLASVQTGKIENKTFKPFDCSKLETEHLRINNRNDCLIIHELSHIIEPNHSKNFWHQVANYCKDFKKKRKWLRENGHKLVL